ncbi:hypothetical protein D3C87_1968890 [compost metagenome]
MNRHHSHNRIIVMLQLLQQVFFGAFADKGLLKHIRQKPAPVGDKSQHIRRFHRCSQPGFHIGL